MPMTLGQLIDALGTLPPKAPVVFDFGGFTPTHLDSYRGHYDQLALGFNGPRDRADLVAAREITVEALITQLRGAIGLTFQGWEGGNYRMDRSTKMWVANPGMCHDTVISGAFEHNGVVVIATEFA